MAVIRSQNEERKELVRLVFVGSPLLDITVECGQETLDEYGLKPDDCVRVTEKHNSLFEQLFHNPKSRLDAGGSALNSAKIAKWALGKRGLVSFAGCVGSDDYSSELFNGLQSCGVEPLFVSLPGELTGVCACLLNSGGKRSMVTRQGAAALFSKGHLESENIKSRLDAARCIFVVGYFVAHSVDVVRSLASMCSPSQLFSLSLSAEYICRDHTEDLFDILPRVDILLGNDAEIKTFAAAIERKDTITTEDAACAVAKIRSTSTAPRIVVVTRGADPVILVRGYESPRYFAVPQDVPVLDSVGCGDALAGAFLATYALTGEEDKAILAGIQAAVKIAQVPGCEIPSEEFFSLDS